MDLISNLLNKNRKISIEEVFRYTRFDIVYNMKNKFFFEQLFKETTKIDEKLLNWIGYKGEYKIQKKMFRKLLKKNTEIEYTNIRDEINGKNQKTYIVLKWQNFEYLLMRMRTEKSMEIRKIVSKIKKVTLLYRLYEKEYDKKINELIKRNNNELMRKQEDLLVPQITCIERIKYEQA